MTPAMNAEIPRVSVVLSCLNEEASLREFHARLTRSLDSQPRSFEIIYVNDGSRDGTLAILHEIFHGDAHVRAIVDLFRNAGQAAALTAGVNFVRGRAVVFMDSDLQLDPEELPRLLDRFDAGADIVSGYRHARRGSFLRRLGSVLANATMRRLSGSSMRDFGCTFKVVDARLLSGFALGPRQPIRLPYLVAAAGRCEELEVAHHERPHGRSGWTFSKLVAYFIESLVGMSARPFQYVAVVLLLLAALASARITLNWLVPFSILSEVTSGLLLNAVLLGGLVGVGVAALVGEYALRSYNLLLGQPAYVIREAWVREPEAAVVDQTITGAGVETY